MSTERLDRIEQSLERLTGITNRFIDSAIGRFAQHEEMLLRHDRNIQEVTAVVVELRQLNRRVEAVLEALQAANRRQEAINDYLIRRQQEQGG
ncbi:hypothetical protein [Gloeobacter morelensis]|uniref:Uncharacterized protein n=1 Tax=Gloeobacter morelensis MG652769 TaxID=2781736 RepID=A0ABY3PJ36_9CYAN|nr:hypothetical protein [Gloeobacter morelensis]UFP93641.1 hypothetical protein ISF26_17900 [Gloeobacter morelensis MG652769]